MKIYYWSPFFTNIATIRAVIKSAESLALFSKEQKYNVSIIDAIGEWDKYEKGINNNINIVRLNSFSLLKYLPKNSYIKSRISYIIIFLWNFFKLKKLINIQKPNFLIIHLMTSLPIFLSFFFNSNTKIILRISGLPKINIFRYLLWKLFENKIYKVTCPTESTYNFIKNKNIFKKNKVEILSDPIIDMKDFLKKKKENFNFDKLENKKYLIGIGRLTKQKNFELLINFFYKIQNKYNEFELVIIGEGEDELKLKNMLKKYNIQNKVHFLGYQANVFRFLLKSECFILTSLWEDPGFVIVEAALSNIPIISSNCPNGPKEIVKNNGFLFKNNNLQDLLFKFDEFIKTDSEKIYKNKVEIKKRIKRFTVLHHYKKLIEILK